MYNVTSRQVTTKVINLSLDGELARNLARLIETHPKINNSRSGSFFDCVKIEIDPKIFLELENLANSLKGHL
jgi:hypothetical protein